MEDLSSCFSVVLSVFLSFCSSVGSFSVFLSFCDIESVTLKLWHWPTFLKGCNPSVNGLSHWFNHRLTPGSTAIAPLPDPQSICDIINLWHDQLDQLVTWATGFKKKDRKNKWFKCGELSAKRFYKMSGQVDAKWSLVWKANTWSKFPQISKDISTFFLFSGCDRQYRVPVSVTVCVCVCVCPWPQNRHFSEFQCFLWFWAFLLSVILSVRIPTLWN